MADTSLQERLLNHQKAFDGLLSLIPAKIYYSQDKKNDQWMKKKQTKEQARAAKLGKLDPDSELNRSAKEVMEELARNKRKLQDLEVEDEDDDNSILDGIEKEKPLEGLKIKKVKEPASDEDMPSPPKKAKLDEEAVATNPTPTAATPNKKLSKEERKSAKKQAAAEDTLVEESATAATPSNKMSKEERKSAKKAKKQEKLKAKLEQTPSKPQAVPDVAESMEIDEPEAINDDVAPIDVSGLVADSEVRADSEADSSPKSPIFDSATGAKNPSPTGDAASVTTSISSGAPASENPTSDKPRYLKIPADTTHLRARLEAKLEDLRAKRKSKDEEGQHVRTRAELMEERRRKQLQRKAHKKEVRAKQKEEEDRKREEALASSRNSPLSMLSPMLSNDPDDNHTSNYFAFGRLAFSDGTQLSHDLTYEKGPAKKKGPLDPKSALAKFEAQKKRLNELDEDKRKDVLEKETWLAARKRAEGEKVHDNEALLKKAVKRKEKAKKKSEKEWKDRNQGVEKGIRDRQKKREENLRKRRDEKGSKGKKKGGQTKPKSRPGFEGSFGGGKRK